MVSDTRYGATAADERRYLHARSLLAVVLLSSVFIGIRWPGGPQEWITFWSLLALLVVGTGVLWLALRSSVETMRLFMVPVLVPDMIVVAGFSYLLRDVNDSFYPVAVLLAVVYALVLSKRSAVAAGIVVMAAYMFGHAVSHDFLRGEFIFFAFKSAAIPLLGIMVSSSVAKQRAREAETTAAVAEKEALNAELARRVSELQAVSNITEIIHSSLDFEKVGPVVLEIVSKLLDIPACCLFVLDKEHSETLFTASYGQIGDITPLPTPDVGLVSGSDHFACFPAFDHGDIMVVLCASAEDIDGLTDEDRLVMGAVASELVVAVENSRLYKLTRKLAVTDELTGLANYRHLQQRLDEEIERAKRYDKHLSLLMIDVDDFKRFNDTQGHMAGDRALAELGRVVSSVVREVDLVARYGGEEFSIVLPETDAAGAFVTAEKVREAVATNLFADAEGSHHCGMTVSIGLASYPAHALDKEALLRESDDALYRAKSGGKNRVKTPVRRTDFSGADVHESDKDAGEE